MTLKLEIGGWGSPLILDKILAEYVWVRDQNQAKTWDNSCKSWMVGDVHDHAWSIGHPISYYTVLAPTPTPFYHQILAPHLNDPKRYKNVIVCCGL